MTEQKENQNHVSKWKNMPPTEKKNRIKKTTYINEANKYELLFMRGKSEMWRGKYRFSVKNRKSVAAS